VSALLGGPLAEPGVLLIVRAGSADAIRAACARPVAPNGPAHHPAAEKPEQRRRAVADRVDDLIEAFAAAHLSMMPLRPSHPSEAVSST